MKYLDEYKNQGAAEQISKQIKLLSDKLYVKDKKINIMEVCGSHTMAIARYAIRELLPENISLISGPGCPVCVTDTGYIDAAIELAEKGVIITTFGDMINVPGTKKTLAICRSEGCKVEICYSPLNAIEIAEKNINKEVVFLAIGFETTMAPNIAMLEIASKKNLKNISILTAFKLIPPALEALSMDPEISIDAFLCPAHVSAIIGVKAYEPFVQKHKIPCLIASFEPVDIMLGIQGILQQLADKDPHLENQYARVVKYNGNEIAQQLFNKYLEEYDASWRGIGKIPKSGLKLKKEFAYFDASAKHDVKIAVGKPNKACRCGDVLKGKINPSECPMFAKKCTPMNPVGPCMVSSEGSCAAYYKYLRK